MRTLLEAYTELERDKWDYYHGHRGNVNFINPFVSADNLAGHQKFIKKYFRHSGKEVALGEFEAYHAMTEERAVHTNSVFFMGLLIRDNTKLRSRLFDERRSLMGYPVFPFIWFLSTLFHDFGMQLERKLDDFPDMGTLEGLLRHFKIEHSLLQHLPVKGDQDLFSMISPYYSYRIGGRRIDHGILAGFYLYDRLIKIRRYKKRLANEELSWHYSLEKKYAIAAAAIACHNIFTATPDGPYAELYRCNSLSYLIQPEFREITVDSYPLLLLFGLVDTIDPIKLYMSEGFQPMEILNNITITFTRDTITFGVVSQSSINLSLLAAKAEGMRGWLAVSCQQNDGKVVLKFN